MMDEPTPGIATPEEVLAAFSTMLRSEKPSEQLKAAENLAKHYGILSPREDKATMKPEVADEIEAAMQALTEAPPVAVPMTPVAVTPPPVAVPTPRRRRSTRHAKEEVPDGQSGA